MAKMTEEEKVKDTFERLRRSSDQAIAAIHKAKSQGSEKGASDAYHAMVMYGRAHGLTNLLPLKRKYRKT